jgi:hypothetical protein
MTMKRKRKKKREVNHGYSHHCISLTLLSAVFKREYRGVHSSRANLPWRTNGSHGRTEQSCSARADYYYAGCCFKSRSPFFPVAVVSHSHIPACISPRLAFCDGAVDGSQDGAAHGLGTSCAGVVDLEAGDHVVGELGLAEDGDTVVRCFADTVETCQFVFS